MVGWHREWSAAGDALERIQRVTLTSPWSQIELNTPVLAEMQHHFSATTILLPS